MGSFLFRNALGQSSGTCGGYKCDWKSGIILAAILSGSGLLTEWRLTAQCSLIFSSDSAVRMWRERMIQMDRETC